MARSGGGYDCARSLAGKQPTCNQSRYPLMPSAEKNWQEGRFSFANSETFD